MAMPSAPVEAVNRLVAPAAGRLPWWALLETLGRRTGRPRRTPVSDGLHGDTFWIVAEHGRAADWVRNVGATPLVRLRSHGGWRAGTARTVPDDDVEARLDTLAAVNAAAIRALGSDPMTVRVDLEPRPPADPHEIAVDGIVAAAPARVFDFLADLSNHDWIGSRHLDVTAVRQDDADLPLGAELVLRRPGLPTLSAATTIELARPPELLAGHVEIPGVARASITWELAAMGGGTRVRLRTRPLGLRRRDQLWLRAGGRAWLVERYDAIMVRLATRLATR